MFPRLYLYNVGIAPRARQAPPPVPIIRTLFHRVRRWDLSMDRLTGYQIALDNDFSGPHTHIRSELGTMLLRLCYVFACFGSYVFAPLK